MQNAFVMAGVMGWPVAHSRSPIIHNHWIAAYGLRGAYGLFPVAPTALPDAVRGLRALGMAGCNITIPHKVAAMALVDVLDPLAQRVGAINTIVVRPDGKLHGYNNDVFGFIESLRQARSDWRADTGAAVVLGSGGAARAVLVGLLDAGATEIRLLNRTRDKALALADEFGPAVRTLDWSERHAALDGAALLVNTTNQGMQGQPVLDLQLTELPIQALVCDIVYTPLQTALLATASQRGNTVVNGLGMLLHQARPAFEAWFGVRPGVTPELLQAVMATL